MTNRSIEIKPKEKLDEKCFILKKISFTSVVLEKHESRDYKRQWPIENHLVRRKD